MVNRILLIAPPAVTFRYAREINPLPPMGLGYLAATLEKMGLEVKILDCLMRGWDIEENLNETLVRVGLSDKEISDNIKSFDPDLVGINCQFSRQHNIYLRLLSLIKKTNPRCITVCGGAHTTVCSNEVLRDPNCDFVILGEAEESFKDLIDAINNKGPLNDVDGLGWKSNDGIQINQKKKWIANLDSIPFPAFHLMDLERYFGLPESHGTRHKKRFMPLITSRGCPAKCTFCSAHQVWGRKHRYRSVENVILEMRLLKNEYGIEEIVFEDDNLTANPIRAKDLFSKMIKEEFNFVWDTPNGVGVWSMDNEMIDLMKMSGCIKLNFPVESGSQHILSSVIKKPLKLSRVHDLIAHCREIGLDHSMFLIIGMPGESIEDIWKSFHFAADCGCFTPHISVATPYPGTELFDMCLEDGLFSKKYDFDDLFTRSFAIATKSWSDVDLKRVLRKGNIYLKYKEIVNNPKKILSYVGKIIKKPSKVLYFFKNP